jgi:hypothetical protein
MSWKEGTSMDAIIGRYRAQIEETGIVLKHQSGICFDLLPDEALGILDFIKAYRQTLVMMERNTDKLKSIVLDHQYDEQ